MKVIYYKVRSQKVGNVAIVAAQSQLISYGDLAVPLELYAKIIQNQECSFFGVNNADDPELGCRTIWTKQQRDEVARYLSEAQFEIEQQVNFPLNERWFADEERPYSCPVQSLWGEVIEAGVRAVTDISLGEAVDYTNDPSVVTVATTVTDENEIHIYHPGTNFEINPSQITISGGIATILIPRCRLVKVALADNPPEGWDYNDLTVFEEEVDVKRVYNDSSTNAELVWPNGCSGCATCTERTQTACMYPNNLKVGSWSVHPATYTEENGWSRAANIFCCRSHPQKVRLNYKAGITTIQAQDTIVRLAHSKMPDEFCGCEVWQRLWRRDRNTPEILTRERLNCKFGLSDGAWTAWQFTLSMRLVRGATL